jgi:hydroxypyruvate isomerase
MKQDTTVTRRSAITVMAGASGTALALGAAAEASADSGGTTLKGRVRHSVCKWCYKMPLEDLCREAKAMGIESIDLLGPDEWPVAKKYGLTCAMSTGPGKIAKGWNHVENHDELVMKSEELLPQVAAAGLPNMIVLSGNRAGISDAEGLKNCVTGLKRIMGLAEQLEVNVVMELLNSKRNHKDYQCDHTAWGVALIEELGSPRFKLLYDIYHMQIMEGDVIATIQENIQHIAHIHTGGVPGRHEIDETQELNYTTICKAIVETGYKGFIAQEFIPQRDPMASLRQAIQICDV